MCALKSIIRRKKADDTQWKEQLTASRENATAMQDASVEEITTKPEAYARYLNMQADNPTYSPGNIALVIAQKPDATIFATVQRWKDRGRYVLDSEQKEGVQIFAKNPNGKGYILTSAYDISQTNGREIKQPPQLENESKQMEAALTAVLNYSVAPLVEDEELPVPAYYNEEQMELAINPNVSEREAFPYIVAEVAHARLHGKGYNAWYKREESELGAQSISYIVCRRFGIEMDLPDMSKLQELYSGFEPAERRSALDEIQKMSKSFGGSIEKSITPQKGKHPPAKSVTR